MGLYSQKPKRIVLEIPEDLQSLFADFNRWCIINGVRKERAFADLIRERLKENPVMDDRTWVSWKDLVCEMRVHGFSLNRTTFWNYRNKGLFADDVRSDGVSTLYDPHAIVQYFLGAVKSN